MEGLARELAAAEAGLVYRPQLTGEVIRVEGADAPAWLQATLSQDLAQHKELVKILKQELAGVEIASWGESAGGQRQKDARTFRRMIEILAAVLKNCQLMPSFVADLA